MNTKTCAFNEIRDHILVQGSRNWKELRERYRRVTEPTWWRWVRAVKRDMGCLEPIRADRVKLPTRLSESVWQVTEGALGGAEVTDRRSGGFDALALLGELHRDAMALRTDALNADGSVRNSRLLDASIRLRTAILIRTVKIKSRVYDNYRAGAFFGAIFREIEKESPAVAQRVAATLRRLQASMS